MCNYFFCKIIITFILYIYRRCRSSSSHGIYNLKVSLITQSVALRSWCGANLFASKCRVWVIPRLHLPQSLTPCPNYTPKFLQLYLSPTRTPHCGPINSKTETNINTTTNIFRLGQLRGNNHLRGPTRTAPPFQLLSSQTRIFHIGQTIPYTNQRHLHLPPALRHGQSYLPTSFKSLEREMPT